MTLEKISFEKYPESKGDFIEVPSWWGIDGWKDLNTKKGVVKGLVLVKIEDGRKLFLTLFADQLRQEGGKLFVSEGHYRKQLERAAKWQAQETPSRAAGGSPQG